MLIVVLCVFALEAVGHTSALWVHFTVQFTAVTAFVMLWSAAASLIRGVHPPAWLKGAVTTYAGLMILAAWLVIPVVESGARTALFSLEAVSLMHWIIPIMAILDFLIFDPHRRLKPVYALVWLIYPVAYFVFIIIRAWMWPNRGPGLNLSSYPLEFLDPTLLGWPNFAASCLKALAACLVVGAVVCLLDRVLPINELSQRAHRG